MNEKTKIIIQSIMATVVACLLLTGVIYTYTRPGNRTCGNVVWQITDISQRQYVSPESMTVYLMQQGQYPVGRRLDNISLQDIENTVVAHDLVRKAECYMRTDGSIVIRLTQRIPLLRVTTVTESYLIDSDHLVMPIRETVKADVLCTAGHIGRYMAQNELADFAEWLQEEDYWSVRILQLEVREGKKVVLKQHDGQPNILLGDIADYQKKLRRVRLFIENYPTPEQIAEYKVLDARFEGQVIGRK